MTLTAKQLGLQRAANATLGREYEFGGKNCAVGGLDCSGALCCWYAAIGISLRPGTQGIITEGVEILAPGSYTDLAAVAALFQFGDPIFLNHGDHVQMWAGTPEAPTAVYEEPATGLSCRLIPEWGGTADWPIFSARRILPTTPTSPTSPPSPPRVAYPGRVLMVTSPPMSGVDVAEWQRRLVAERYDIGGDGPNGDGVDGMFGQLTFLATRVYQVALGFTGAGIDGKVGPATWARAFR